MKYLIKLSKEGHGIGESDANQSFSSDLASHSIFNVLDATSTASDYSVTIPHGLDYVPKVWVYIVQEDGDGQYYQRLPIIRFLSGTSIDYYITDTSVVIDIESPAEYSFKVVVFTRSPSI